MYDKNQRQSPDPPKMAELLLFIYNHSYRINGNFDDCLPYMISVLMRTPILEARKQNAEVRNFLSRSPKHSAGGGDGSGQEQASCGGVCPWAVGWEASPFPRFPASPKFLTKFITVISLEILPQLERTCIELRSRVGLSVPGQVLLRQRETEKKRSLKIHAGQLGMKAVGKSGEVSTGFSRRGCLRRMDGSEEQE